MVMVSYSWVSVLALFVYLFLFLAFASAKKSRVIYSFMILMLSLILYTGGSFMMRIQFWPTVNFWNHVSIAGILLVPFGFYRFYIDFLDVKRRRETVFWFGFFALCFIVNVATGIFIPNPQIVEAADGRVKFLYHYSWHVYILFGACGILLAQIVRLFFKFCRGDALILRQLRPIVIGIILVAAGSGISTLKIFAGLPMDVLSTLIFAVTLFYALYQKRMFKLTVLVSHANCYVVAVLVTMLFFYNMIIPLRSQIEKHFGIGESLATLVIAMMIVAVIYVLYIIMKKFLDNLFVKEEQIQAETIKEFSYAVSKTLDKDTILSDLVEVIRKTIRVDHVYVCINDGNGDYVMERTASPLENKDFVMKSDHPLVVYLRNHEGCLLMQDYKRTSSYLSMWEKEKKQLDDWKIECFAPMKDSSELVGIVMLSEKKKSYSFDDYSLLMSVNSVCSMAVKNSKMYELAYNEARKDELTGLFNRKRFYELIEDQFEKCRDRSLALVMINVDDFRLYNQLYGAQEGDLALQKIAAIIQATTGDRGYAFRLTGKEFAVLLPSYDLYSAKVLAESVSEQVRRMNANNDLYSLKVLTLSCGVCASPYLASSVEELITNTDLALYSAKRAGKNAVVMYSEDVEEESQAVKAESGRVSYYDAYASTIYALTAAIDTKDHYTFNHSQNVAYYASELARAFGMNEECIDTVREAGLLHDIGKIGIREDILNKPGRLNYDEYEIMKTHVENSIGIIRHLPSLDYVIPAVLSHHERYDGKGYPRGVAGEDIPVMGRMLCIVDAFDAMISRRTYKKPMPVEQALEVLRAECGRQFDPKLAELFIELVQQKKIELKIPSQDGWKPEEAKVHN